MGSGFAHKAEPIITMLTLEQPTAVLAPNYRPFLLAMNENNDSSIGNKRSRNEDFTDEGPATKKIAVFPLHQACSSGNEDEVIKLLSGTHVNIEELVHELNNEGLSPMQCLEDSYKKIMRTDLASRNSESETKIPKIAAILVMHGSKLPEPEDDYSLRFRLSPFLHKHKWLR